MSKQIDERVVSMKFDNQQFEANARKSMSTLDKLKKKLSFKDSEAGDGIDEVTAKVSRLDEALKMMYNGALFKIGGQIALKMEQMVKSLTVTPVAQGWEKYNEKIQSVQTIVNSTGKSVEEVDKYLEKLMWFSDETSYSFTDMTNALAGMLTTGADIEKLIPMIEGMATATSYAGKGSAEFSRVLYNLNQSYSQGFLSLMDWKSVQSAGVASKELINNLIAAAEELGTIKKGEVTAANFTTSLSKKVFTAEVMEKAFGNFSTYTEFLSKVNTETGITATTMMEALDAYDESAKGLSDLNDFMDATGLSAERANEYLKEYYEKVSDIGKTSMEAAQEAKSFKEVVDALSDAVSSGWMETFNIIFGSLNNAKALWGEIYDALEPIFNGLSESRNNFLKDMLTIDRTVTSAAVTTERGGAVLEKVVRDYAVATGKATDATDEHIDALYEEGEINNKVLASAVRMYSGYNDETLKSLGYTHEQIKEIRNLGKQLGETNGAFRQWLEELNRLDGREKLIEVVVIGLNNVYNIMQAIGHAFKAVFSEFNGSSAAGLIDSLHNFATRLKPTQEFLVLLTRTFRGLFAAIDIVYQMVKIPIKIVFEVFNSIIGNVTNTVFGFTASLGDVIYFLDLVIKRSGIMARITTAISGLLVKIIGGIVKVISSLINKLMEFEPLRNAVLYTFEAIGKAIKWLIGYISGGIEAISKFIDTCKEIFDGPGTTFEKLGQVFARFFKDVIGYFIPVEKIWKKLKEIFAGIKEFFTNTFSNVGNALSEFGSGFTKVFGNVFEKIKGFVEYMKENWNLASLFTIATIIALLVLVNKAVKTVMRLSDAISNLIESLTGFIDVIRDLLASLKTLITMKTVKTLAVSVAIMTASIIALSVALALLGENKAPAYIALGAIMGMMAMLTAMVAILAKASSEHSNIKGLGRAFLGLSSIILSLGIACGVLATSVAKLIKTFKELFEYDESSKYWKLPLNSVVSIIAAVGLMAAAVKVTFSLAKYMIENQPKMTKASGVMIQMLSFAAMFGIMCSILKKSIKTFKIEGSGFKAVGEVVKLAISLGLSLLAMDELASIMNKVNDHLNRVNFSYSKDKDGNIKKVGSKNHIFGMLVTMFALSSALKSISKITFSPQAFLAAASGVAIALVAFLGISAITKKFDNGKVAGETAEALLKLTIAAGALALFASMIGRLDASTAAKGVIAMGELMAMLMVFYAVLGVVSAITKAEGVIKGAVGTIAGMTIMASSLAIFSALLGFLDFKVLAKGLLSMTVIIALVDTVLLAIGSIANAGGKVTGADKAIMSIVYLMSALTVMVSIMGYMPEDKIRQGIKIMAAVTAMISVLILSLSTLSNLASSRTSLQNGKSTSKKGLGAVVATMVLTIIMIGELVAGIAVLSSLPNADKVSDITDSLAKAMIAISASMFAISKSTGRMSWDDFKNSLKKMGLAFLEFIGLAMILPMFQETLYDIDENRLLAPIEALSVMLIALSVSANIISRSANKVDPDALLGVSAIMLALAILCPILALTVDALSGIDHTDKAIENAGVVAVLLLGITAASIPISKTLATAKSDISPNNLGSMLLILASLTAITFAVSQFVVLIAKETQNINTDSTLLIVGETMALVAELALLAVGISKVSNSFTSTMGDTSLLGRIAAVGAVLIGYTTAIGTLLVGLAHHAKDISESDLNTVNVLVPKLMFMLTVLSALSVGIYAAATFIPYNGSSWGNLALIAVSMLGLVGILALLAKEIKSLNGINDNDLKAMDTLSNIMIKIAALSTAMMVISVGLGGLLGEAELFGAIGGIVNTVINLVSMYFLISQMISIVKKFKELKVGINDIDLRAFDVLSTAMLKLGLIVGIINLTGFGAIGGLIGLAEMAILTDQLVEMADKIVELRSRKLSDSDMKAFNVIYDAAVKLASIISILGELNSYVWKAIGASIGLFILVGLLEAVTDYLSDTSEKIPKIKNTFDEWLPLFEDLATGIGDIKGAFEAATLDHFEESMESIGTGLEVISQKIAGIDNIEDVINTILMISDIQKAMSSAAWNNVGFDIADFFSGFSKDFPVRMKLFGTGVGEFYKATEEYGITDVDKLAIYGKCIQMLGSAYSSISLASGLDALYSIANSKLFGGSGTSLMDNFADNCVKLVQAVNETSNLNTSEEQVGKFVGVLGSFTGAYETVAGDFDWFNSSQSEWKEFYEGVKGVVTAIKDMYSGISWVESNGGVSFDAFNAFVKGLVGSFLYLTDKDSYVFDAQEFTQCVEQIGALFITLKKLGYSDSDIAAWTGYVNAAGNLLTAMSTFGEFSYGDFKFGSVIEWIDNLSAEFAKDLTDGTKTNLDKFVSNIITYLNREDIIQKFKTLGSQYASIIGGAVNGLSTPKEYTDAGADIAGDLQESESSIKDSVLKINSYMEMLCDSNTLNNILYNYAAQENATIEHWNKELTNVSNAVNEYNRLVGSISDVDLSEVTAKLLSADTTGGGGGGRAVEDKKTRSAYMTPATRSPLATQLRNEASDVDKASKDLERVREESELNSVDFAKRHHEQQLKHIEELKEDSDSAETVNDKVTENAKETADRLKEMYSDSKDAMVAAADTSILGKGKKWVTEFVKELTGLSDWDLRDIMDQVSMEDFDFEEFLAEKGFSFESITDTVQENLNAFNNLDLGGISAGQQKVLDATDSFWKDYLITLGKAAETDADLYDKVKNYENEALQSITDQYGKYTEKYSSYVQELAGSNNIFDEVSDTWKKNAKELKKSYRNISGIFTRLTKEASKLNLSDAFSELNASDDINIKDDLFDILEDQLDQYRDYGTVMASLKSRVKDSDVLAAISELGIDQIDNLRAMDDMTDEELSRYISMLREKMVLMGKLEVGDSMPLIDILREQYDQLREYSVEIEKLASRIGNGELLEAIEDMGIDALDNIKELNSMTGWELDNYIRMFEDKSKLAEEVADRQTARAKERNTEAIKKQLMQNMDEQIEELSEYYFIISDLQKKLAGSVHMEDIVMEFGMDQLDNLRALNTMTEAELDSWVKKYDAKYELAEITAKVRTQKISEETKDMISNLLGGIPVDLSEFEATWDGSMDSLNAYLYEKLYQMGFNQMNGIGQGVEANSYALIWALSNFDKADELSKVYISKGYNLGEYLAKNTKQGITSNTGSVVTAGAQMADTTADTSNAILDAGGTSSGENFVLGIIKGINNNAQQAVDKAKTLAQAIVTAYNGVQRIESPSKVMVDSGMYFDMGIGIGIERYGYYATKAAENVGIDTIESMSDAISTISDMITENMDTTPTIAPVLDLEQLEADTAKLNTMLSRDTAIKANLELNATTDRKNNQNGSNDALNAAPNISYVQNNYSPKALSRVEIYRQTRNQLSSMKGMA